MHAFRNLCSLDDPVLNKELVCAEMLTGLSAFLKEAFTLWFSGEVGVESALSKTQCADANRGVEDQRKQQLAELLRQALNILKFERFVRLESDTGRWDVLLCECFSLVVRKARMLSVPMVILSPLF